MTEKSGGATRLGALLDRRLRARSASADGALPVVAVAMANNPEVIGAIGEALCARLAAFVLIGPSREIASVARDAGVDLGDTCIVEESDARAACARAARMAADGEANVVMKGLVQTSDFVRAILNRDLGLVADGLLSHVALCDVRGFDRLFLMTDAAITTYPDAAQKRLLVLNALACARPLGFDRPRVAMVAPVEKVSEKVPSTIEAANVVASFAGDDRLLIDGPFGLDVAISDAAAAIKGIAGEVAGRADVIVLPNIDAANVLYKSLTGFAGAHIAGIVAGAVVPIVLTSRADSEEAKLDSLRFALAAAGESQAVTFPASGTS